MVVVSVIVSAGSVVVVVRDCVSVTKTLSVVVVG